MKQCANVLIEIEIEIKHILIFSLSLQLHLSAPPDITSKLSCMGFFSIFSKEKKKELDKGLEKSKESFFAKLAKTVAGKSKVDDDVLDNLEEVLVTSDVGVETTLRIIERIESRVSRDKYLGTEQLNAILKEEIVGLLLENDIEKANDFVIPKMDTPYVMLVVGVNGVGKTTTIGKLAYQFKQKGYSVYLYS